MKTVLIFFKALMLFITLSLLISKASAQVNSDWSEETNFAYQVICSNAATYTQIAENQNNLERSDVVSQRTTFKALVETSAESIKNDTKNGDYNSAAYTCAMIDELTSRFTRDCYGLGDQKIDLSVINQACNDLINTYN